LQLGPIMQHISTPFEGLSSAAQRQSIGLGIIACLLFLILYTTYSLCTALIYPASISTPTPPAHSTTPHNSQGLFGLAPNRTDNLPTITANATLHGVISTAQNNQAMAFVSVNQGPSKVYQRNDTIPGLGQLLAIHPNFIVIRKDNQKAKLSLIRPTMNLNQGPQQ
jgi:hypothetical protein